MNVKKALAYAERHGLHALLIARDGQIVSTTYGDAGDAPHPLYSGTKSFWGPVAILAQSDGVLTLDEPVAATLPEWHEGERAAVTLRMLLDLTAGIGFGGLGASVPTYERARATPLKNVPGSRFTYGGIPLQIFGAVVAEKLAPETPHDYLERRILRPAGITIEKWRTLADGTRPLPTGAFMSASMWLRYGELMLERRDEFAACFRGSAANPRYGLTWWLKPPRINSDVVYASGSGGQALYLLPALNTVVAHFGRSNSWSHEAFLRALLAGAR